MWGLTSAGGATADWRQERASIDACAYYRNMFSQPPSTQDHKLIGIFPAFKITVVKGKVIPVLN
jgi:hypothetical protein